MPEKKTIKKARQLKREGKSPSTQASEFVKEEIERIRNGKHGARSAKQAIAIGLSRARRAGVELPAPKKGKYSEDVREKAQRDLAKGKKDPDAKPSSTRSRAVTEALKKEGQQSVSHRALSRHAKSVAKKRTAKERSEIAKRAAASRTPEERSESAKKAARTRKRNQARR
ncbi:MAG: hypothetical protein JST51_12615 [Armatimonadetes bacterium]|nr:hypothetical protein [Armatimonadota bacterium]